jgi:hypothetical protein
MRKKGLQPSNSHRTAFFPIAAPSMLHYTKYNVYIDLDEIDEKEIDGLRGHGTRRTGILLNSRRLSFAGHPFNLFSILPSALFLPLPAKESAQSRPIKQRHPHGSGFLCCVHRQASLPLETLSISPSVARRLQYSFLGCSRWRNRHRD